ncbi:MAG: hypothetical protein ACTHN3_02535 [Solirubrobacterales bacterium]
MAKRRWRDYKTVAGRRPVKEFLEALSDEEVAAVSAAMKEVESEGLRAARHLRNAIYEIRTRCRGEKEAEGIVFPNIVFDIFLLI